MFSFFIRCLEHYLSLINDVIAVSFLAIILRDLAWERGGQIEWFGIFVGVIVKPLFETTLPEFYGVFLISFKEIIQLTKNGRSMRLVWMQFAVKYFLCSMDRISDHNNFWHTLFNAGLINVTSNNEQFCLHACYEHCMMNCLDERMVG